jgi:hypothetical protein
VRAMLKPYGAQIARCLTPMTNPREGDTEDGAAHWLQYSQDKAGLDLDPQLHGLLFDLYARIADGSRRRLASNRKPKAVGKIKIRKDPVFSTIPSTCSSVRTLPTPTRSAAPALPSPSVGHIKRYFPTLLPP